MASIGPGAGLGSATWRKSSRSNNGGNCVEAAAIWRKSSRSDAGGNCVEAAPTDATIAVRDSKDPYGPKLAVTARQWAAFARSIQRSHLPA